MDPYYVLSDWSVNGPSRHDGFVLVRYANLIGLSQYPVFKVQAAADSLHILRFCPLRTACVVFGGKEIQYALALRLSTGCLKFFASTSRGDFRRRILETTNASRTHRKASKRRSTASLRLLSSLWFRLPIPPTGFQHTLQCLSRLSAARCRTVSAPARGRKGFNTGSLYLPTNWTERLDVAHRLEHPAPRFVATQDGLVARDWARESALPNLDNPPVKSRTRVVVYAGLERLSIYFHAALVDHATSLTR